MSDYLLLTLTAVGVLVVILGVLRLRYVSLQSLVLGLMGAIVGLIIGALASVPLSKLPAPFGVTLPLAVTIIATLAMMVAVLGRRRAILGLLPFLRFDEHTRKQAPVEAPAPAPAAPQEPSLPRVLVDTSVIIDGRISDIAAAGFVPGRLVVPRFVLAELQNIADSDDAMRRGRGRRGLDVLNQLREMPDVSVEISEDEVPGVKEVDAKLVALAQKFSCNVLTTDYNLNRVAQIQGVRVLNVNELSNAIRPVVLPGETLMVRMVQPGKERNQGVGYLADGTMIVVEDGDKLIGQEVATEVTRVFQTVAGKMIFAIPKKHGQNSKAAPAAPNPEIIRPEQPDSSPSPEETTIPATDAKPAPRNKGRYNNRHRNPGAPKPPHQSHQTAEDRVIAAASEQAHPESNHPNQP